MRSPFVARALAFTCALVMASPALADTRQPRIQFFPLTISHNIGKASVPMLPPRHAAQAEGDDAGAKADLPDHGSASGVAPAHRAKLGQFFVLLFLGATLIIVVEWSIKFRGSRNQAANGSGRESSL